MHSMNTEQYQAYFVTKQIKQLIYEYNLHIKKTLALV